MAQLAQRRIMLTGTPLQNDLVELQNLLRFLLPALFTEEHAALLQDVQASDQGNKPWRPSLRLVHHVKKLQMMIIDGLKIFVLGCGNMGMNREWIPISTMRITIFSRIGSKIPPHAVTKKKMVRRTKPRWSGWPHG